MPSIHQRKRSSFGDVTCMSGAAYVRTHHARSGSPVYQVPHPSIPHAHSACSEESVFPRMNILFGGDGLLPRLSENVGRLRLNAGVKSPDTAKNPQAPALFPGESNAEIAPAPAPRLGERNRRACFRPWGRRPACLRGCGNDAAVKVAASAELYHNVNPELRSMPRALARPFVSHTRMAPYW